jgi:uncharacterized protein YbbK (DUF523 family)
MAMNPALQQRAMIRRLRNAALSRQRKCRIFQLCPNAIDGMLLDQAKTEIQAVCKNVRQILNKDTNADVTLNYVTNYFLYAVTSHILTAVHEGLPSGFVTRTFSIGVLNIDKFNRK